MFHLLSSFSSFADLSACQTKRSLLTTRARISELFQAYFPAHPHLPRLASTSARPRCLLLRPHRQRLDVAATPGSGNTVASQRTGAQATVPPPWRLELFLYARMGCTARGQRWLGSGAQALGPWCSNYDSRTRRGGRRRRGQYYPPRRSHVRDDLTARSQVCIRIKCLNSDVEVFPPFPPKMTTKGTHITYLDTVGRPSYTFTYERLTEKHLGVIYVRNSSLLTAVLGLG
jgi:hypothetical protein